MRPADVLRTAFWRGEVLLNPDAFLRMRSNSSVRLLSDDLVQPRFEFLTGAANVNIGTLKSGASVTAQWKNLTISSSNGVYRLDSNPPSLRVYSGTVQVDSEGRRVRLGKGKMIALSGELTPAKFDTRRSDSFDKWSGMRAAYIERTNERASRRARRRSMFSLSRPVLPPASYGGTTGATSAGSLTQTPGGYWNGQPAGAVSNSTNASQPSSPETFQ
jgi:hypothetical protein